MCPKLVPLSPLNIRKQNIILHILIAKSIPDPGIRFKKEYQDSRLKATNNVSSMWPKQNY